MSASELTGLALAGATLASAGLRVIDGHCHLGAHAGFFQPGSDAAALVTTMDRIGIEQACVFASLAITQDMRAGNDLSLDAAHRFPNRLLAYAAIDPHRGEAAVEDELVRCFKAGIRGIKLHTQLAAYPFDGPGYAPVFAFAHTHRLPVISHGVGSPETLRRVAQAHPGAHLIVAHAGASGPLPGAETGSNVFQVALEEPNVYLDLASSSGRFGAFKKSVDAAGVGKLLFGSDMPWMCASHQVGRVLFAPIEDEAKRRILGGTMATLLATRC